MLQVRKKEILACPQIAHGRSRCVWAGAQLVDHLRKQESVLGKQVHYYIYTYFFLLINPAGQHHSECSYFHVKAPYFVITW